MEARNDPAPAPATETARTVKDTPSREVTYVYHLPNGYDRSCINVLKRAWLVKVGE